MNFTFGIVTYSGHDGKDNLNKVNNIIDGKSGIDSDSSDGEPQDIKPEISVEKLKTKTDPEEGLLGGGMPDPTPA